MYDSRGSPDLGRHSMGMRKPYNKYCNLCSSRRGCCPNVCVFQLEEAEIEEEVEIEVEAEIVGILVDKLEGKFEGGQYTFIQI